MSRYVFINNITKRIRLLNVPQYYIEGKAFFFRFFRAARGMTQSASAMNPRNRPAKGSIALCGPDFFSGTIALSTACNRDAPRAIHYFLPTRIA
jgi:hypothetical protein